MCNHSKTTRLLTLLVACFCISLVMACGSTTPPKKVNTSQPILSDSTGGSSRDDTLVPPNSAAAAKSRIGGSSRDTTAPGSIKKTTIPVKKGIVPYSTATNDSTGGSSRDDAKDEKTLKKTRKG